MTARSSIALLICCRPEFTRTLIDECRSKCPFVSEIDSPADGLVTISHVDGASIPALVFERQRLMTPRFIPNEALKPVTDEAIAAMLGDIVAAHPLWTVHHLVLADDEENPETTSLTKRLDGIWNVILRLGKKSSPDMEKRFRPAHRIKPGGIVLQLLMTREGVWYAHQPIEQMLNPRPGGFTRMKFDPLAPSRSYLKMEEALERMPQQPVAGENVIDLGAAPGGWTYAFIKRGCHVLAVDHGPMKLAEPQPGWGTVQHIRENGITFAPPTDWHTVDWLVADMLITPGVALGLLRRWLESERATRIICNIKLPQEQAYAALAPVLEILQRQHLYQSLVQQLYHDRREVTVMAWKH